MVLLSLTQHECTGLTVFGISVAESRLFHVRFTISGPDCIHSNPRPTHDSIVGKEQEGSVEFVVAAIGANVPTPTLKLSSSAPTGCHYFELSVHIYVFAHTKRYLTFDIFAKDSGLTHCKAVPPPFPSIVGCNLISGNRILVFNFVLVMVFETGTIMIISHTWEFS
jgi:hypothetical protein